MPIYTPNQTIRYIYTDFINVMNIRSLVTLNIYVNSVTGQDTGPSRGGSPTNAYKSLKFALNDAFTLMNKSQVVIHLAGADPHVLDDGFVFPEILSPDQITLDATPTNGLTQQAPLVLRSTPTLAATIAALSVVSQANNANSGLKEITTTGGLVVNAFQNKWLQDANGVLARVISNTATVINIDYAGDDLTAPFLIYGEGATIAPANEDSTNPTVVLRGGAAPIVFFGIEVETSDGGAVQVGPGQQAMFIACNIPRLELGKGENSNLTGKASVECHACLLESISAPSCNLQITNSRLTRCIFTNMLPDSSITVTASSIEDSVSAAFSDGESSPGFVSMTNCLISDSDTNNIQQIGGILKMETCDVEGAAASGIRGENGAQLTLNAVTSSAINAAGGLVLSVGSVAEVDADTVLTGTAGQIFVGNLATQTFANFRVGVGNVALISPEGSVLYQGTSAPGSARNNVDTITVANSPYSVPQSNSMVLANAVGGAITVTLPTAASANGRDIIVKKIDAGVNVVTVDADGGETIDGAANVPLAAQWDVVTVRSNGTAWFIVNSVIA